MTAVRCFSHFVWLSLLAPNLQALQHPQDTDWAWLTVLSRPPGAELYVDSIFVGKTPVTRHPLAPGKHTVRVFSPSVGSWNAVGKTEEVQVVGGEEVELSFELGTALSLNTSPSGATVALNDVPLGTTPFYYRNVQPLAGQLSLVKDGYQTEEITLDAGQPVSLNILLSPLSVPSATRSVDVFDANSGNGRVFEWTTYASATSMIVSGVLAAYLKDVANRDFDRYLRTKEQRYLDSTRRLDTASGIALAVSHVSLGLLAYILLSE